jgi:hypothetical protein
MAEEGVTFVGGVEGVKKVVRKKKDDGAVKKVVRKKKESVEEDEKEKKKVVRKKKESVEEGGGEKKKVVRKKKETIEEGVEKNKVVRKKKESVEGGEGGGEGGEEKKKRIVRKKNPLPPEYDKYLIDYIHFVFEKLKPKVTLSELYSIMNKKIRGNRGKKMTNAMVFKKCESLVEKMVKDKKKDRIKLIKEGYYLHIETNFVIQNEKTSFKVIGKIAKKHGDGITENEEILPLTKTDIQLCKEKGYHFELPDNLDEKKNHGVNDKGDAYYDECALKKLKGYLISGIKRDDDDEDDEDDGEDGDDE